MTSYYLTANDGETVEFYFQNNSAHQVLLGLYIDGENTFGKRYQHPLQTPTENHWVLPADGKNYAVRSWHSPAKSEQSPIVVRRQPGPTGGRSAGDPSGTITAIFYTNGTEGIDVPPPIQVRGVNIEAGEPEPAQLRTMPGRKGLMLAAVTIHYRSSDEMGALRGQGGP